MAVPVYVSISIEQRKDWRRNILTETITAGLEEEGVAVVVDVPDRVFSEGGVVWLTRRTLGAWRRLIT